MPADEVMPNETEPVCWQKFCQSGGPHKQTLTNAVAEAQTQIRFCELSVPMVIDRKLLVTQLIMPNFSGFKT